MAELILTDAERDAALWQDLDDASLGKVCKQWLSGLDELELEHESARMLMLLVLQCLKLEKSRASKFTYEVSGLKLDGENIGTWKVEFELADLDEKINATGM